MNAKEAREKAIKNAERAQRYRLHYQLEKDEKMLENAVNDAVQEGRLYASVEIDFDRELKYDCGENCNICCHFGEFHSKSEYVERLVNPYVADGYAIRYEYAPDAYALYSGSIKCVPGKILKLEICWFV